MNLLIPKELKVKINILIWALIVIPSVVFYSSHVAKHFYGTDFPVYYMTAKRMVDPSFSIKDIYQLEAQNNFLPEKNFQGNHFIYSPVIAPLLSPLGFLSYYTAKTTLIFLNIMAYLSAIALMLKLIKQCRWLYFLQAILFMWMPIVINTWGAQVNGIILLIIVGGVNFAKRKKDGLAGTVLGFSALFKIFPIVIALFLGFSNRRITTTAFALFALALLAPGTLYWFKAMPTVSAGHTPVYLFLSQYGFGWVLSYSSWVVLLSMYCILRAKTKKLLVIFAYSIPIAFTSMPVVQYHHLIILVVTYIIIFYSRTVFSSSSTLKAVAVLTSLHINLQMFWKFLPNTYWSVLVIWIVMSWVLLTKKEPENVLHANQ